MISQELRPWLRHAWGEISQMLTKSKCLPTILFGSSPTKSMDLSNGSLLQVREADYCSISDVDYVLWAEMDSRLKPRDPFALLSSESKLVRACQMYGIPETRRLMRRI